MIKQSNNEIVMQSPLKLSKKKPDRVVRFRSQRSMEEVYQVESRSDYKQSEFIAVWGRQDEQKKRQQQIRKELQAYVYGLMLEDDTNFTTIGLKDKFGTRREEKQRSKEDAWSSVLWEQYHQYQDQVATGYGGYNDELLAAAYERASRRAGKRAQTEAILVELEVRGLLQYPAAKQ